MSRTFHRRLVWRDLAYWQLHHWPHMASCAIRPAYEDVEWAGGEAGAAQLAAWQQGRTGYPLIDAGVSLGGGMQCLASRSAVQSWQLRSSHVQRSVMWFAHKGGTRCVVLQ